MGKSYSQELEINDDIAPAPPPVTRLELCVYGYVRRNNSKVPDEVIEICLKCIEKCDRWSAKDSNRDCIKFNELLSVLTVTKKIYHSPDYAFGSILIRKGNVHTWRLKFKLSKLYEKLRLELINGVYVGIVDNEDITGGYMAIHLTNHKKCALSKIYPSGSDMYKPRYLSDEITITLDMLKRELCFYFNQDDESKVLKQKYDDIDIDSEYRLFVSFGRISESATVQILDVY